MQPQIYKIISTGETYSLDKATGKATKIDMVPPGARVLTWAGAGLPPDLQNAQMPNSGAFSTQDGAGGPGTTQTISSGGKAYAMGDHSLVKFQDSNGRTSDWVWLLDNKAKTMRPFTSQQAFENAYAGNLDAANKAIVVLHAADRGPGGSIADYETLDPSYAIQNNGAIRKLDASAAEISQSYGKPAVSKDIQDKMVNFVGGFLNMLQKTDSGIDSGFVEKLKTDPKTVAFYINAATYGGYTPTDIYRDLKRKELLSKGDRSQENINPISATTTRSEYAKTDAGRSAYANPVTKPPQALGGIDPNIMNYAIFDLPDEAFKTLVPPLKRGSPEMQAYMDKVNTAAHDILIKQIEARTESEKAVADHEWKQFKTEIEKTLGIKLSNNSLEAWKQLETARDAFSQRGISGSGLESETIDDYLRTVRRSDQLEREATLTSEEKTKADYYKKFATSAEIAALTPEEKMKYGLAPSEEIKSALSFDALKKKYPEMPDNEINALRASILDENNNYRSNLYQKKTTDIQKTEAEKKTFQQLGAEDMAKTAAEEAAKQFTSKVGQPDEFARDAYTTTGGEKKPSTLTTTPETTTPAEAPATPVSAPVPPKTAPITPPAAKQTPVVNPKQVSSTIKNVLASTSAPKIPTQVTPTQTATKPWSSATATDLLTPKAPASTPQPSAYKSSGQYIGMPTATTTSAPTLAEKTKTAVKGLISKVKSWF